MIFSKKWNPDGLHCYVTGGSQGLGLSLAKLLTRHGANVSVVARDQIKLDKALKEIETERRSPNQKLNAYSFALDTAKAATEALEAVCEPYDGEAPDATFTCAGAARPGFFVEMTEEDLANGMTNGYWIQAWTAWAVSKMMVKQNRKGKITFVSSTLGLMSFVGYSSYSPAKHALRGLADTLHSEMLLYSIDIHIFFPPTMYTPGYEEENKFKPKITLKIEEADDGLTPDLAALALFKGDLKRFLFSIVAYSSNSAQRGMILGVQDGHAHIAGDFMTGLFRASTRGAAPRNSWCIDGIYDLIAYIGVPIWRASVDRTVTAHAAEHQNHLRKRNFFS